ncbi:MAG: DUF4143 domain-containing protein [archaeon]|nr:DUF4143 domain-containing protein [archaeon]
MDSIKGKYLKRVLDSRMGLYLQAFGAVCVEGPKYCGKTWFALNASNSSFMLADPADNYNNKALAKLDINIVFEGEQPHLIDEWQDLPLIWDATKVKVDENLGLKGQYILTGSSTPDKKGISHTGVGRIGILKLRTMTLFESGDSTGDVSLKGLFENDFKMKIGKRGNIDNLIYLTVRGGWPSLIGSPLSAATIAVRGYVDLIVEEASTFEGVRRDRSKIYRTLRSLARNESTLAKITSIVSDTLDEENDGSVEYIGNMKISETTVTEYLDIFDRMFLIENQCAFNPNLKSSYRVGKLPKRHFTDPSLAIAALNLSAEQLKSNISVFGFYFEALCERDLAIYASANDGKLYHYRDHANKEVDAVVELSDGRWGAFEIKLGMDEVDSAAENLLRLLESWKKNGIGREPEFLCVITGMGGAAYRREDGVYVVPITMMKD